jgi:hypothetical protein
MHQMHVLTIRKATFHKAKPPQMTRNPVTRKKETYERRRNGNIQKIIFTTQRHLMAVSFTATLSLQERMVKASTTGTVNSLTGAPSLKQDG